MRLARSGDIVISVGEEDMLSSTAAAVRRVVAKFPGVGLTLGRNPTVS